MVFLYGHIILDMTNIDLTEDRSSKIQQLRDGRRVRVTS